MMNRLLGDGIVNIALTDYRLQRMGVLNYLSLVEIESSIKGFRDRING